MKQFTFLQEESNRILSKVQKSFWSCTHVNSCSILYFIHQSTYFIEYFIQGNFKHPRINKIHQFLEKITRHDERDKIYCVLLSHELLSTKIYYTSIYIFYLLFIQDNLKNPKNDVNPTCTSRETCKTIFLNFI